MIRHVHSILCSLTLAALVPVRRVVGRAHTKLVRAEARIATRRRRLEDRIVREAWPLHVGALALAVALTGCGQTTADVLARQRALFAECARNLDRIEALHAPAEERLQLYDAEGLRCREAQVALCRETNTCGEYGE